MRATKLRKARDLVAKGWCQGPIAKDKLGGATMYNDPEAVRFCAYGAFLRSGLKDYCAEDRVLMALTNDTGWGGSMISYNESRGRKQSEVVAMMDWAIGITEAGGIE